MNSEYRVTVDNLIKDELDGKATAIARYDEMLWKIRTGYAAFLYGSFGIIAGLVRSNIINPKPDLAMEYRILVFG